MQRADPIIRTKLHRPFTRQELVPRPRLQEQVGLGLHGPLTLITAPAGFGKTTLVASSISECRMPVAWLALDANDNQPGRFITYMVAAFAEVSQVFGPETAQLLESPGQAMPEVLLASLINDLVASSEEIALVLDDYQFITSQAVHAQMSFLLEHCPQALHLLIASRSDPPLPLARLRARGQMMELRAADLRFTPPEAAQFLNDVMALHLDAPSVELLEERTEGWIAGLQMAALSMRDREDVRGFIEGFSGTNRFILDYLLEEILVHQKPEIQQFLLQTSILDRLTVPLCDALMVDHAETQNEPDGFQPDAGLLAPSRSASILEYIERANLFLVALDDERQWFRYHHLFASLLRTQLKKTIGVEGVNRLHMRAAKWYEENGWTLDAIHHASVGSDVENVERLIGKHYLLLMKCDEMSSMRFWTTELSRELVLSRPRLCVYAALSHAWFGQVNEAEVYLREAEKKLSLIKDDPEMELVEGHLIYLQSRVAAMHGDMRKAISLIKPVFERIPPEFKAVRLGVEITFGYEYYLDGDFEEASKILQEIIEVGHFVNDISDGIAAHAVFARLLACQGQLRKAYDQFQKALQWLQELSESHLGSTGIVEVGMAELQCESNDLDNALAHLERGLELTPLWGKPDDMALGYATYVRIHLARGDRKAAAGVLAKAVQLIRSSSVFSESRSAVEVAQVKYWLVTGQLPEAERWAASLEEIAADPEDTFQFKDEFNLIARARILIALNRLEDSIALLTRLEATARSWGRTGRLIEILMLKAMALYRMGDMMAAQSALAGSLSLAEPEGYLRIFLDEGQPMQILLSRWLAHVPAGSLRNYVIRLLAQLDKELQVGSPQPGKSASDDGLLEPVSTRESEVLHLMALGMTNQQIADQLIISPGTVKAHTSSIYRKLCVANRTEAVARARQLDILP